MEITTFTRKKGFLPLPSWASRYDYHDGRIYAFDDDGPLHTALTIYAPECGEWEIDLERRGTIWTLRTGVDLELLGREFDPKYDCDEFTCPYLLHVMRREGVDMTERGRLLLLQTVLPAIEEMAYNPFTANASIGR
jgi:hypothetical protein